MKMDLGKKRKRKERKKKKKKEKKKKIKEWGKGKGRKGKEKGKGKEQEFFSYGEIFLSGQFVDVYLFVDSPSPPPPGHRRLNSRIYGLVE